MTGVSEATRSDEYDVWMSLRGDVHCVVAAIPQRYATEVANTLFVTMTKHYGTAVSVWIEEA